MNIWIIMSSIFAICTIIGIISGIKNRWDLGSVIITALGAMMFAIFIFVGIVNKADIKETGIRQLKEREQIVYQIEHLTEDSDKIKLNEWILTYNDWVNDVNTNKETFGWFSWYKDLDMSNHSIIDLV